MRHNGRTMDYITGKKEKEILWNGKENGAFRTYLISRIKDKADDPFACKEAQIWRMIECVVVFKKEIVVSTLVDNENQKFWLKLLVFN